MKKIILILTLAINLILATKGCSSSTYINYELFFAIRRNDINRVRSLLSEGVDVNVKYKNNYTPLHVTTFLGHTEITKLLLENRANVNVKDLDGYTPLHYAVMKGYTEIVAFYQKTEQM